MKKRIVIIGDSISQGIGGKKINYVNALSSLFNDNIEIYNLAFTGTTIEYATKIIENINQLKPDILIIMYGNVDAQIRPNIKGNKYKLNYLIPKRYKHNGMLDPRPFYSKKWYRFFPDRLDNILRKILRLIVAKTQGYMQCIPINEFIRYYNILLDNLEVKKNNIFMVSTIRLDERYYPFCLEQYKKYNEEIKKLAFENTTNYIDLFEYIDNLLISYNWDDIFYKDHYHPNEFGYQKIAELLFDNIQYKLKK